MSAIEKLNGKKSVIRYPLQRLILFIPPLTMPLLPYILGVQGEELTTAICAMVVLGFIFGFYLISADKFTLKVTKEDLWLTQVGRWRCRVERLTHDQIESITLNQDSKTQTVTVSFLQNDQTETLSFNLKKEVNYETLNQHLRSQTPELAQKIQFQTNE